MGKDNPAARKFYKKMGFLEHEEEAKNVDGIKLWPNAILRLWGIACRYLCWMPKLLEHLLVQGRLMSPTTACNSCLMWQD